MAADEDADADADADADVDVDEPFQYPTSVFQTRQEIKISP